MNNNNTTTASDNSSDSASNNKRSTKSEIEIIDKKIIKCINEINSLKQKKQREWSKQMNSHLRTFYDDDLDSINKSSVNNESMNSNTSNSFSTPQSNDSSEHDKKIFLLHKKLKSYEKRRQKLLYDSKKEQENSNQTNINENLSESKSETGSNNAINNLLSQQGPNQQITPILGNLHNTLSTSNNFQAKLTNQSDSTVINNDLIKNLIDEKNPSFYLNTDANMSNMKFGNNNSPNMDNSNYHQNEDHSSYQLCLTILQQVMELKIQQDKIQSDLESLKEKQNENYQQILKDFQIAARTESEPVIKAIYGFIKTNDQKIEETRSSLDRSLQPVNYNLNLCSRDVKEVKDDLSYVKNKIEIIDKTQKIPNIENTSINFYQLAYKFLDSVLTILTLILITLTNMYASIKFVFLLYPRAIVLLLFFYFIFVYVLDSDLLYFNHLGHLNQSNSTNSLTKALNNIYGLVFFFKNRIFPDSLAASST
ncbi:unnamed protein product [Brachionus calyciflorus]|uniref:Transmembrane protein n=1 Tax=Brachionus calyciflorus TaxID=104777 RepID=A0A813SJI4_9BILA|nr:unnamed protein product [Brachionus calyciflorus]